MIIPQRPFNNRLPGLRPPPNINQDPPKRQPPPYQVGVPIPEQLFPDPTNQPASQAPKQPTNQPSNQQPLPAALPTRPGYEPAWYQNISNQEAKKEEEKVDNEDGDESADTKDEVVEEDSKSVESTSKQNETPPDRNNILQNEIPDESPQSILGKPLILFFWLGVMSFLRLGFVIV